MNLEEKLYTSTEVAKILGVSLRSVYRYLDQGKLHAEIKTATGRLRFTKQDILNFLYPDGEEPHTEMESSGMASSVDTPDVVIDTEVADSSASEAGESDGGSSQPLSEETSVPSAEEAVSPESVDWLERFRAAADAISPQEPVGPEDGTSEEPPVEFTPDEELESLSSLGSAMAVASLEPEEVEPETPECLYFKSSLGGLKEIAQNVDKVSRKASVDYAFTLYAGLSLEKPLKKPFSILHLYVDPEAVELYRRLLQLEPTSETDAQVCLMLPRSEKVLANKVEKHGLYVVDDSQLAQDFEVMGLGDEYKSLL